MGHLKETYSVVIRLLIYLSSPAGTGTGASDDVVASFMPSPQALVEMDRDAFTM